MAVDLNPTIPYTKLFLEKIYRKNHVLDSIKLRQPISIFDEK